MMHTEPAVQPCVMMPADISIDLSVKKSRSDSLFTSNDKKITEQLLL